MAVLQELTSTLYILQLWKKNPSTSYGIGSVNHNMKMTFSHNCRTKLLVSKQWADEGVLLMLTNNVAFKDWQTKVPHNAKEKEKKRNTLRNGCFVRHKSVDCFGCCQCEMVIIGCAKRRCIQYMHGYSDGCSFVL